jgi:chemotaxis protein CheX
MKAEILNAFLDAAVHSLSQETRGPVQRTGLLLDPSEQVADELIVYVALVGEARGMMLVSMPAVTAREVAAVMVGEPQPELNEMGLSALAELGNLIAGGACVELDKLGLSSDITPPTVMIGHRSRVSTLGLPRFVIPLTCAAGALSLHVAVDVPHTF